MKDSLKFLLPILMILFSLACKESGEKDKKSASKNLPTDFIKVFEGKIDDQYSIIAKIQSNAGVISGNYQYTNIGQELKLLGTINSSNEVEIKEYDEKDNETGVFVGQLVNENKLEGVWSKIEEEDKMPFYLIASNTPYEQASAIKAKIDPIKILYRQEEYDEELESNIPVLKVNEDFLKTADDGIRAIIGFYSAISGTDCWWNNDQPNDDFSNLNCKLTSALNLGRQCSESHKSFLKKWFSGEEEILKKINECYAVPYTASSQTTYDYLNLEVKGNEITARYKISGINLRVEADWQTEGVDQFRIADGQIEVISRKVK